VLNTLVCYTRGAGLDGSSSSRRTRVIADEIRKLLGGLPRHAPVDQRLARSIADRGRETELIANHRFGRIGRREFPSIGNRRIPETGSLWKW